MIKFLSRGARDKIRLVQDKIPFDWSAMALSCLAMDFSYHADWSGDAWNNLDQGEEALLSLDGSEFTKDYANAKRFPSTASGKGLSAHGVCILHAPWDMEWIVTNVGVHVHSTRLRGGGGGLGLFLLHAEPRPEAASTTSALHVISYRWEESTPASDMAGQ